MKHFRRAISQNFSGQVFFKLRRRSVRKVVVTNFTQFTGKYLGVCFFNEVAGLNLNFIEEEIPA